MQAKTIDWSVLLTKAEKLVSAPVRIGAVALIIFSLIAVTAAGLLHLPAFEVTLGVAGFLVGAVSLVMMILISNNQDAVMRDQGSQIKALGDLNTELRARGAERERVKRLFLQSNKITYTCVMPVEYRQRPLPTIAAGDYYAWHVIQNFGIDIGINMKLTNRNHNSIDNLDIARGSIIFLCSPQSNPPLAKLAPWLRVEGGQIRNQECLKNMKLPVWFGMEIETIIDPHTSDHREWQKPLICYLPTEPPPDKNDIVNVLYSPVEELYKGAGRLKDDERPKMMGGYKSDLALIVRASRRQFDDSQEFESDEKIIIIAGLHQYGTWIAGHFLQQICAGEKSEDADIFLSDVDFAAVIYGQFNENKLCVEDCNVHGSDAWHYIDDKWMRVKELGRFTQANQITTR